MVLMSCSMQALSRSFAAEQIRGQQFRDNLIRNSSMPEARSSSASEAGQPDMPAGARPIGRASAPAAISAHAAAMASLEAGMRMGEAEPAQQQQLEQRPEHAQAAPSLPEEGTALSAMDAAGAACSATHPAAQVVLGHEAQCHGSVPSPGWLRPSEVTRPPASSMWRAQDHGMCALSTCPHAVLRTACAAACCVLCHACTCCAAVHVKCFLPAGSAAAQHASEATAAAHLQDESDAGPGAQPVSPAPARQPEVSMCYRQLQSLTASCIVPLLSGCTMCCPVSQSGCLLLLHAPGCSHAASRTCLKAKQA